MKKTLLFALALLLSVTMFAQNRAGFISQHFDGETMPEGWSIAGLESASTRKSIKKRVTGYEKTICICRL